MKKFSYPYPTSIGNAARLLDVYQADWYKKIDVTTLNQTSPTRCVLGQVFDEEAKKNNRRGYHYGMETLFDYNSHEGDMSGGPLSKDNIFGSKASVEEWKFEISKRINTANSVYNIVLKPSTIQVNVNHLRAVKIILAQSSDEIVRAALIIVNEMLNQK